MYSSKKNIRELTRIKNLFDIISIEKKEQLVAILLSEKSFTDSDLLKLHETMLFLKAYPSNKAFLKKVIQLQNKVNQHILHSIRRKKNEGIYEQTGVLGTCVNATFSFELVVWLAKEYPKHVIFDSFGASEDRLSSIISSLLPLSLKENYTDGEYENTITWLQDVAGKDKRKQLQFLLQLFSHASITNRIASQLMEQLELYIKIDLAKLPSRSNIIGLNRTPFHHTEELLKKFDLHEIIKTQLPHPTPLTLNEKNQLITSIRFQLISLYRETDPGTNTDFNDIIYYRLERGIDIVLLGMDSTHRQSVDAYIGFFAFKNQMPYAYGGTWLLGSMAKIGLNIFPSYRGGESAWFFAQLMRVYYQEFNPDYFIAEPYQVGRGNPEGIESGAFWFYYKLGYRPLSKSHQALAEKEFSKLKSGKIKNTSAKMLEHLVEEELGLMLNNNVTISTTKIDTLQLSVTTTQFIRNKLNGDLKNAIQQSLIGLRSDLSIKDVKKYSSLQNYLESIALYLYASGGLKIWSKKDKKLLLELIEEKINGTDSNYAKLLRSHHSLNKSLLFH